MASESKKLIGVRGEDLACAELERQGIQVLERNWRCRLGEIDIIAAEAGGTGLTLVFCEVKCRSGLGFGHPLEPDPNGDALGVQRQGSKTGPCRVDWRQS